MARRGHGIVGNFDTEVVCPGCGKSYLLLHRIVARSQQELQRKFRSASLPLWQRCHHCGYLVDDGAKQAKLRLANQLAGIPLGPDLTLTEDIVSVRTDNLKLTIACLGASLALYLVMISVSAERCLGPAHDWVIMPVLLLGALGLINAVRIASAMPRYLYFAYFWNPQSRAQLEKWNSWWNADGRSLFQSRLRKEGMDEPWEPEVY